jgi:hypothetical protein
MRTCVADSSVVNLDADFVGLWWGYFDVFDGEVLAGFPGDSSLSDVSLVLREQATFGSYLAGDGLASQWSAFVLGAFIACIKPETGSPFQQYRQTSCKLVRKYVTG